jgi:hypothetical protein
MRIAGLTPNEWAKDTLTVLKHTENAELVLTALVERIAAETAHEMAMQVKNAELAEVIMSQICPPSVRRVN